MKAPDFKNSRGRPIVRTKNELFYYAIGIILGSLLNEEQFAHWLKEHPRMTEKDLEDLRDAAKAVRASIT